MLLEMFGAWLRRAMSSAGWKWSSLETELCQQRSALKA